MVDHHKPEVPSENIRLLCSWSRAFKISVVCLDSSDVGGGAVFFTFNRDSAEIPWGCFVF